MELPLLAASLRSRNDYELVRDYIDIKQNTYSKEFQVVMSKIGDYYSRDADAERVVPEVLIAQLAETVRNPKHVALFSEKIAEAAAHDSSDSNVRAIALLAKQQEVGDRLALAISSGLNQQGATVRDLWEQFGGLMDQTDLRPLDNEGMEALVGMSLRDLIIKEKDPHNTIKIYPSSLNDRLDGGAKRGHHIVVYGRPESMKTGTVINIGCGAVRQGFRVCHFINEDRPEDIYVRKTSNLSGMNKYQIYDDPERAEALANEVGGERYIVVNARPGSPSEIEEAIEQYEPDVIIVDQLRNLKVKADNRVNQLEHAATSVRNIAKKRNVLAISVTQAGDSANGKQVLDMGDVDFSNTGIPAQADVMIGVGVDATLEAEGRRVFSLPKNKISGNHEHFFVNVIPQLSRVTTV